LTPRGGRDAVEGWARDPEGRPYLKARVAAPAVQGAANAALETLLAKTLDRPKRAVRIVGGSRARLKHVEIEGADEADLARVFGKPS
jgi:hypothetical protein